jgi:hypothetical protein
MMLDESLQKKFSDLSQKIIEASYKVTSVADAEIQKPPEILDANRAVDEVVAEYQALYEEVPEGEQLEIERTYGRRVTDLRRLGARLPELRHSEKRVELATDDAFAPVLPEVPKERGGGDPFAIPAAAPRREEKRFSVGHDVEAWCSPCGELKDHTVAAMVNDEPVHVICRACGAKHKFRTTPPVKRKKGGGEGAPGSRVKGRLTKEQVAARRKEEERLALQRELAEASEVVPFNRRQRYKVGQILEHPDHGRGRIENVLKGSMLVRFRGGLKSVSTL